VYGPLEKASRDRSAPVENLDSYEKGAPKGSEPELAGDRDLAVKGEPEGMEPEFVGDTDLVLKGEPEGMEPEFVGDKDLVLNEVPEAVDPVSKPDLGREEALMMS